MTHLTGICRSFLSLNSPKVNNPLFTLHRIFTSYHTEIKREKRKVNSVNNQIKKNFFSSCVIFSTGN